MEDFCKRLPKLELHAHLNGSVRHSTLIELAGAAAVDACTIRTDRNFDDCWALFSLIHKVTAAPVVLRRVAIEMVEDFVAENCVYLEVRSTPKPLPTRRAYVECLIDAFREAQQRWPKIAVGLLLSINRSDGIEAAIENLELAIEYKGKGVIGLDISGNPRAAPFAVFEPLLLRARAAGLPLAVHFAEIPHEAETAAMLALRPERLGHACYLTESEEAALIASRIPVEICMTSNLRTRSVPSYEAHHLKRLVAARHPVVLCTDDPGLFHATLSSEYAVAAKSMNFSKQDLYRIAAGAVEFAFAEEVLRAKLRATFKQAAQALGVDAIS